MTPSNDINNSGARRLEVVALCLAVAGLALAGGCATARRARVAQRPEGRLDGERTTTAETLRLGTNTVLTMETVIRLALTNSPAMVQARAQLTMAEAQLTQARAGYLPTVGGTVSENFSGRAFGQGDVYKVHSGSLALGDDLLSFGRTLAAVHQARAALAAARATLRATEQTTIYNARVAFYALYRAQELLGVDEASVDDYRVHLEQVQVMAQLGTRIRYDVTKAEVDLGNARLAALSARNGVLTARAALSRAIGLAEALPGVITNPAPVAVNLADRPAFCRLAATNNPALLALRADADAASAAVDAAIANFFPDLSLGANLGYGGSHFPLTRSWSLGPAVNWTLFDGWRRAAAVDAAVAGLRSTRATVADREQQLQQDLINAFASLDTARDKTVLVELLIRQARENLDLTRERYRLGMATSVELTDAEVALTQTRSQQVEAQYAEWVALASLRLNAGLD